MIKAWEHFKLITKHKYYVFQYCRKAGLIWQGITHDLSKYSPVEFFESVKYFDGSKSPIDVCKKKNGYSAAWMHHKGRNKHHFEYWQDDFVIGGRPLVMPYKYALEMICDYLAAGRAYMKDNFTYEAEYAWWKNRISRGIAMHIQTQTFVDRMLSLIMLQNSCDCLRKDISYQIYLDCVHIK